MTGEITLRGEVLPVGGIKEKVLAAKRAKIKEIILCELNRADIEEIEKDSDRDNFMSAEQAKEYGLIDEVIGIRKNEKKSK